MTKERYTHNIKNMLEIDQCGFEWKNNKTRCTICNIFLSKKNWQNKILTNKGFFIREIFPFTAKRKNHQYNIDKINWGLDDNYGG